MVEIYFCVPNGYDEWLRIKQLGRANGYDVSRHDKHHLYQQYPCIKLCLFDDGVKSICGYTNNATRRKRIQITPEEMINTILRKAGEPIKLLKQHTFI